MTYGLIAEYSRSLPATSCLKQPVPQLEGNRLGLIRWNLPQGTLYVPMSPHSRHVPLAKHIFARSNRTVLCQATEIRL